MNARTSTALDVAELLAAGTQTQQQLLRLPSSRLTLELGEDLARESGRLVASAPAQALRCSELSIQVGWRLRGERAQVPVRLSLLLGHAWLRHGEARRNLDRHSDHHESYERALGFLPRDLPQAAPLWGLLCLAEGMDILPEDHAAADEALVEAIEHFQAANWRGMVVYTRLMRVAGWAAWLPEAVQADLEACRFKQALAEGAEALAPGLVAELEAGLDAGEPIEALVRALETRRHAFEWAADA